MIILDPTTFLCTSTQSQTQNPTTKETKTHRIESESFIELLTLGLNFYISTHERSIAFVSYIRFLFLLNSLVEIVCAVPSSTVLELTRGSIYIAFIIDTRQEIFYR